MPCCRCLRLTPTTTTTASSSTAAFSTDGVHGGAADLVILCPWLPHVGGFAVLMVVVAMDRRSLHAAVSRRPWHFHLQSGVESDDAATAAASSGKLMGRVHCRCFRLARRVLVSVVGLLLLGWPGGVWWMSSTRRLCGEDPAISIFSASPIVSAFSVPP